MRSSVTTGTRYSKPAWDDWYKTRRWKKLRLQHLARYPHCQCPIHQGTQTPGNVVDHVEPHKGDTKKFWNPAGLQTLTKYCHDRFKQSQEKGGRGFDVGCDTNGDPLNKLDHWR